MKNRRHAATHHRPLHLHEAGRPEQIRSFLDPVSRIETLRVADDLRTAAELIGQELTPTKTALAEAS